MLKKNKIHPYSIHINKYDFEDYKQINKMCNVYSQIYILYYLNFTNGYFLNKLKNHYKEMDKININYLYTICEDIEDN